MEFNFFIGCISKDDVKTRYRSLAKVHHPDKGGDSKKFVDLSNEYAYIVDNSYISFPIKNAQKAEFKKGYSANAFTGDFHNWYDKFTNFNNANNFKEAQDLAEKQRRYKAEYEKKLREEQERIKKDPWYKKKMEDPNYTVIEQLIVEGSKQLRTTKWFLMEVYKLDDLTLDHFKFIRETLNIHSRGMCNLVDSWVSESYRNYVAIQQMEWRY